MVQTDVLLTEDLGAMHLHNQAIILPLLEKLIEALKEKLGPELDKYLPKLKQLLKILGKFIKPEELKEVLTNIIAKVKEAITDIVKEFLDSVPLLRDLIKFIEECIKDGSFNNIGALLKKLFTIALSEFKKKIMEIYESLKEGFKTIREKLADVFQEFINKLDKLWDKIKEFFKERFGDLSLYEVPADIAKRIGMFYSSANPQLKFSHTTHAKVAYNKMKKLIAEKLGEEAVEGKLAEYQKEFPNNFVGQYIFCKKELKPEENK